MPRPRNDDRPRTKARGLFSRRPLLLATPALLSLTLNLLVALLAGIPHPTYHDEFSYLLAADTFSHFRATNPPHPFWPHFETIHVIHQPTYASKYPPAQGLFMAAGQITLNRPIAGLWLATALAAAAVTWALTSLFPRRWAFIGGIIAATHPLTLLWSHEYWGGAVPMLGGALLLGGALRLRRRRRPRTIDALLLSTGLALLANSRPYEGLVLTLVTLLVISIHFIRSPRKQWGPLITRALLPSIILLSLVACAMAYYNHRVTGNAFKLPYLVHEQQYGLTPLFLFQPPRPTPTYRHQSIANYHTHWALPWYTSQQSVGGFLRVLFRVKLPELLLDYTATGALALPLIVALITLKRSRRLRRIAIILLLFLLGLLPATWVMSHYAAPGFVLFVSLVVGGLRRTSEIRFGRPLVAAVLLALLVTLTVQAYQIVIKSLTPNHFSNRRHATIEHLLQSGGRHLVLVRYGTAHSVHEEWIYNAADIDASAVVFAREIAPDADRMLMDYYADRHVHLLDVSAAQITLTPLRAPSSVSSPP